MDPMRRRLTVSQGLGDTKGGKGGGPEKEDGDALLKRLQLAEVFEKAFAEKKQAISILSKTDDLREKAKPFANKDEIHVYHPKLPKEEMARTKQWLESNVGWTCNKGLKPEACNQDCMSILVVEDNFSLYGVYDGHGPLGHDVSEYVCAVLPGLFLEKLKELNDPEKAFHVSFQQVQKQIVESPINADFSGTTCTMAYHDVRANRMWVSHVGDSRSIAGTDKGEGVKALTIDHKPDLPKERARIENSNPPGRVLFDGFFNHRVFAKDGQYPGLNMSRALGDCLAHERAGLTAEPDVIEIDLNSDAFGGPGDRVLLLCTDGVWEFINDEEAMGLALKAKKSGKEENCTSGIAELARSGYQRWLADSDNEISDDITGLLVKLPARGAR